MIRATGFGLFLLVGGAWVSACTVQTQLIEVSSDAGKTDGSTHGTGSTSGSGGGSGGTSSSGTGSTSSGGGSTSSGAGSSTSSGGTSSSGTSSTSSSSGGGSGGGSTSSGGHDSGVPFDGSFPHPDAGGSSSSSGGADAASDSPATASYDGTTGKACTTDADCHSATGPGINKCSIDGFFTSGQLYPTPVCLVPPAQNGNCNPGTDGNLHFCDGPDDPSSPGICLATGGTAAAPTGICLPQCSFTAGGASVTGCIGKDACNTAGFGQNSSGTAIGVGYCFGGCDADGDCQTGQKCETYTGLCVTAPTTPAAGPGTGCTYDPSTGASTPACNCLSSSTNDRGFCTLFCHTGGTECPSGWKCDAFLPRTLTGANDASVAGFTTQVSGLAGSCTPGCTVGGTANFDGGACPANSSCLNVSAAGPDCTVAQ